MDCIHFLPGDLPGGKAHKTAVILQLRAGYIQKKLIVSMTGQSMKQNQ